MEKKEIEGWLNNLANNDDWTADGMRLYAKEALETFRTYGLSQDAKKYYARYRNNLKEWAEDDDQLREAAKKVFPEKFVEGDTYGVPPMMYLVDCLVCRVLQLEGKLKPENWDTDGAWEDVQQLYKEP